MSSFLYSQRVQAAPCADVREILDLTAQPNPDCKKCNDYERAQDSYTCGSDICKNSKTDINIKDGTCETCGPCKEPNLVEIPAISCKNSVASSSCDGNGNPISCTPSANQIKISGVCYTCPSY